MMSTQTSTAAAACTLRIEGELSIYRAAELKEALLAPLNESASLDVDLSAVSEMDSAGVQLLLLAKQTAQARGCELRLHGHSPAVLEVFELLELAAHFGDPLLMPARAA